MTSYRGALLRRELGHSAANAALAEGNCGRILPLLPRHVVRPDLSSHVGLSLMLNVRYKCSDVLNVEYG